MIRATTPTHTFVLPFDYNDTVLKCLVTYKQFGKIILDKREGDIRVEGNTAIVQLSQEETKLFGSFADAEVQLRVLTNTGDALASQIFELAVRDVLNDEILSSDAEYRTRSFQIPQEQTSEARFIDDDCSFDVNFGDFIQVGDGEDGATFTPFVDEQGNLSWTNDKGLPNPPTVNIKGAKGEDGEDGIGSIQSSLSFSNWGMNDFNNAKYNFKLFSYSETQNDFSADVFVRFRCKSISGTAKDYFRYAFSVKRPFVSGDTVKSRIQFIPQRVMQEGETTGFLLSTIVYEKASANASNERELWIEVNTGNGFMVDEIYSSAVNYSGDISAFAIEAKPNNKFTHISGYDDLTITASDWSNKNAVLSLDSRATAEGATVGGTGNRVDAKDGASFGTNGKVEKNATASLQGGSGNTNRAKNVIQGGENNVNDTGGSNSVQGGSGNFNNGAHSTQFGLNGKNYGSNFAQFGHTCINYGDHGFQQGWECVNEYTKPDNTKDGYNYVDMVGSHIKAARNHQMVRGIYNAPDTRAVYVFGNGTSDSNRVNIYTMAASGAPEIGTDLVPLSYFDSEAFKKKIISALPRAEGVGF